jgi:PAS domain S-box-containing protein
MRTRTEVALRELACPPAMRGATRLLLAACVAIPAGLVGVLAMQSRRRADKSLLGERRRSGRRLRDSEERYRSLFNSIDEGFCIVEVLFDDGGKAIDYRFLEVNPSFEKQTGLSGAQGKRMRELAPQHEEHWFEVYGNVARTGEPIRFVNRAEQLQRWYDVYAFRHGAPELHHVGILFNDITARLRAEQAIGEEASRKDQFLALLAHELRSPLAPIRYAVQVLSLGGPHSKTAMPELLPMMERQVAHMARLLDDLLDVSRITRGTIELRKEKTDFRAAVQIAVEANRPLIESMDHALAISLPADPLWLVGDPARLVQIVSNLVNNAANYSPASSSIHIRAERDSGWIVLRVKDSGSGICTDDLQRIFGLFVQIGNPPYRRQQGGLGIGLSLVHTLVELHGGTVTAHSDGLGLGSEFVVRLP